MNIINSLSESLLNQKFDADSNKVEILKSCQQIAQMYAQIEHAIAVLSDLQANTSYIYKGKIAETIGLESSTDDLIDTIWEEEIFDRIHPDDLFERHLLELHFFQLLKSLPINEREKYHTSSIIRMKNREGQYISVRHRTFYLHSTPNGSLWLDMCLYNLAPETPFNQSINGNIVDITTGRIITLDTDNCSELLSKREKEILILISEGKLSKEIAAKLSISIHTVSRHRQNILEKLNANSSIEAISLAKALKLIE